IRNAIRFLLANLEDFDPVKDAINEHELEEIDRYMLVRLQNLVSNVKTSYENYDFSNVFNEIHNYASNDLRSFYLDFAKDILYIETKNSHSRRRIQIVYYEKLISLTKLLIQNIHHTNE